MTEDLRQALGTPVADDRWEVDIPADGRLSVRAEPGGRHLLFTMDVVSLDGIGDLRAFATAMMEQNFMWRGGPFSYAVSDGTVILQERVEAEEIPDGAALEAYGVRAAQALNDARNLAGLFTAERADADGGAQ